MGSVKLTIGEKKDKWLANADVLSCGFEQEKGYKYFKCQISCRHPIYASRFPIEYHLSVTSLFFLVRNRRNFQLKYGLVSVSIGW